MEPMFVDGFERHLKVSAEYGGAVKLDLYGVREIVSCITHVHDSDV